MKLIQSISLSSIHNARELGGYKTVDGYTIRNGVLLRTSALHDISDNDIDVLKNTYHLGHIIDFRMDMELTGMEDPAIEGAQYHHLDVIDIHTMMEDHAVSDFDSGNLDMMQIIDFSVKSGMIGEDMYIGFLSNNSGKTAFSEFFRILLDADPDRAVLWHCTSGKDRTGLAAMLLLSAFDVDEDLIIKDYLLTNEFNADRIEGLRRLLSSRGCDDAFISNATLVFSAVNEKFLRKAISFLKQEYGSVNGYITTGLGISQTNIDSLKEKYLVFDQ